MSAKTDIEAAFDAAAAADAGTLALGDRAPVPCLVPEGVEIAAAGDHRSEASAVIIARKDHLGKKPSRFEAGTLNWAGEDYNMAVNSDTIGVDHGTFTFTMAG